jgi:heme exporter protein CcmB
MVLLCLYEIRQKRSTLAITGGLCLLYIILIPILLGFSPEVLYLLPLGLIWICILWCFLTERLFQPDLADGTLELYCLSSSSLEAICLSKKSAYWVLKLGGIWCSCPLVAFLYQLEPTLWFGINLMLGSYAVTLICAIHSCFTLGINSNAWNSVQHLTTLPTVLPCVLLCHGTSPNTLLIGYCGCLLVIYLLCVPASLRHLLSV